MNHHHTLRAKPIFVGTCTRLRQAVQAVQSNKQAEPAASNARAPGVSSAGRHAMCQPFRHPAHNQPRKQSKHTVTQHKRATAGVVLLAAVAEVGFFT